MCHTCFWWFWRTRCRASTGRLRRRRWGCPWRQIGFISLSCKLVYFAACANSCLRSAEGPPPLCPIWIRSRSQVKKNKESEPEPTKKNEESEPEPTKKNEELGPKKNLPAPQPWYIFIHQNIIFHQSVPSILKSLLFVRFSRQFNSGKIHKTPHFKMRRQSASCYAI